MDLEVEDRGTERPTEEEFSQYSACDTVLSPPTKPSCHDRTPASECCATSGRLGLLLVIMLLLVILLLWQYTLRVTRGKAFTVTRPELLHAGHLAVAALVIIQLEVSTVAPLGTQSMVISAFWNRRTTRLCSQTPRCDGR